YHAGEKEIVPRVVSLLQSEEPRFRDGALRTLGACGNTVVLENLSKLIPLLRDPEDFVQITAVKVISKATDAEDTQLAMLQATIEEPQAVSPNSVGNASQYALFMKDNVLANTPFAAGFDEELVRQALEDLILMDPAHNTFTRTRLRAWEKDTMVRVAGPLTYAAEEEQIVDQMFAGRAEPAQALLGKFGWREGALSTAHRLRKQAAIPRHIRPLVGFKRPLMNSAAVKAQPAAFHEFIDELAIVLTDDPNHELLETVGEKKVTTPLADMYSLIAAEKKPTTLPSIYTDARALFEEKLAAGDGTGAKMKLCRAALKDPAGRDYFRKIAAMDTLTEMLGAEALEDLVPYLNHDYYRLRDHSRKLAGELVTVGGGEALAGLFEQAATTNPHTAAGILAVFAGSGDEAGRKPATKALAHDHAEVRAAGVRTIAAVEGIEALPQVLAHLVKSDDPFDFLGCEDALLVLASESSDTAKVRDAVIAALPKAPREARAHAYYVLARIGDDQCIATLRKAGETDSVSEFGDVVFALSYAHSREADQVLLDFARTDEASARVVGAQAVRRMVLGPAGFDDITDAERMDFAEPMLKLNMDLKLIKYLGRVRDARALRALMYCLQQGVEEAADALITNGERLPSNLPSADAKVAAKALQDVIEYIEVTRLRGGVEAHMKKEDKYYEWKALQARAGRALLRVHQPEKAPIPGFDPLDLDP
ncbi:MAG: HEAT repeat domain-containing protein, partial [Akkermansiaceae bacterium]|nr:HEAT repeat domain-containing protein [Akkermansiaceae bacterium]